MRCKPTLPEAAEPLLSSFCVAFSPQTFQRFLVLLVGATLSLGRRTVCCLPLGGAVDRPRTPQQLPPRLQPRRLVAVAAGQGAGGGGAGTGARRAGGRDGRRHRRHAQGQAGLRQREAPRRLPLDPLARGLEVGAQVGRAGGPRHLPVLLAGLGLAGPGGVVPARPIWTSRRSGGIRRPRSWPGNWRRCWCGGSRSGSLSCWATGVTPATNWRAFCRRHRKHLTLVSRLHPRANLYDLPPQPKAGAKGRPRVKGRKRAAPADVVARTPAKGRACATVNWYGGGERQVELISGSGHWYKGGEGLVAIRWVFVHDLDGTHRDEYFYSDRPGPDGRPDRQSLYRPLGDRGHVPGSPPSPGIRDHAPVERAERAAGRPLPAGTVQRRVPDLRPPPA